MLPQKTHRCRINEMLNDCCAVLGKIHASKLAEKQPVRTILRQYLIKGNIPYLEIIRPAADILRASQIEMFRIRHTVNNDVKYFHFIQKMEPMDPSGVDIEDPVPAREPQQQDCLPQL